MARRCPTAHRIVIGGGGAGGLELATRLGDRVGHAVDITLIDRNRTHVWKPKLHEIAAGSMDFAVHEVDYPGLRRRTVARSDRSVSSATTRSSSRSETRATISARQA